MEDINFAPFERLLDMKVVELGDGFSRLVMPYRKKFTNPSGIMHGGAIVSLIDTSMALSIKTLVDPHAPFFTAKLEIKFKAPVKEGTITAESWAKIGKRKLIMTEVVVKNQNGKVVATSKGSFLMT